MEKKNKTIKLQLPKHSIFELEKAVCNHGFFMMAPNRWLPDEKRFVRPLSIIDNTRHDTVNVTVYISQPPGNKHLLIDYHIHHGFNATKPIMSKVHIKKSIKDQVSRMLHISERDDMQLAEFYKVHPRAKEEGYGRIIRSPTIFEDVVKSVLLNNVQWSRSLEMAQALCDLQFKLSKKKKNQVSLKRKRPATHNKTTNGVKEGGNFPTPEEIACLHIDLLVNRCKLGYRGPYILEIARKFCHEKLAEYLERETNQAELLEKLKNLPGVGPFTAANIMMCLGFYDSIPTDSETIKHLQEVHEKEIIKKDHQKQIPIVIAEIYDKYAPYQCLAYWRERVQYYERKMGKLSDLPHEQYRYVVTPRNGRNQGA